MEAVKDYVNRLSVAETKLGSIGNAVREPEKCRKLLKGIQREFQVAGDIIRGMENSINNVSAFLVVKEGTLKSSKSGKAETPEHALQVPKGNFAYHLCIKRRHCDADCFLNPNSEEYRRKGNTRKNYVTYAEKERDNGGTYMSFISQHPMKGVCNEW